MLSTATGYAIRHEAALLRFLENGRLKVTNNHSERALRTIAVGRKNWLFCGSDDHATSAASLFSLIASSKLHGLDPETYLAEVIHVMPYWPARTLSRARAPLLGDDPSPPRPDRARSGDRPHHGPAA